MKKVIWAALAAASIFGAASAEEATFDKPAKGWWTTGSTPQSFDFGITQSNCAALKCAFIRAKSSNPGGFGTLMQQLASDNYIGKRVRVSATIKTLNAERAGLWLRIDGPNGQQLGFSNMDQHPITGTTEWKRYTAVLDVPPTAVGVAFGYFLYGKGEAWADGFKFEIVNNDVPVSEESGVKPLPKVPANLGFDQ